MDINRLINKLRDIYGKVLVDREDGNYLITIEASGETPFLLCLFKPRDGILYGKIGVLDMYPVISCIDMLYHPHGLFIFSRDMDEFVEKLVSKIDWLKKLCLNIGTY